MGRRQFTIAEQAEIYECPCGTPDILEMLATMADEEREGFYKIINSLDHGHETPLDAIERRIEQKRLEEESQKRRNRNAGNL